MPFIVFPSSLVMVLCHKKYISETETTHVVYNFPDFIYLFIYFFFLPAECL